MRLPADRDAATWLSGGLTGPRPGWHENGIAERASPAGKAAGAATAPLQTLDLWSMQILWLSHLVPYPPKGGVLQRSYHMVRELGKRATVDLIAFNQMGLMQPLFPSVEEGLLEARQELGRYCRSLAFVEAPIDAGRFAKQWLALRSLAGREPYTIRWLRSRAYAALVRGACESRRYDIVHFDTISLSPYLDQISSGCVRVLDHHNVESHMMLRRASLEHNPLKRLYYWQEGRRLEHFERRLCGEFDLNLTCSALDSRRLQDIAPSASVAEVPNGVDVGYFAPDPTKVRERRMVFVGTLNWYPNVRAVRFIANELWPPLRDRDPSLHVDIVGANPPRDLVELARRDDRFLVHGFVDDIRPLLDRAAVYVCPITDGGGTKLKILDALAMGKAIVAHPVACEGIDIVANENVLLAETVDEFVSAIHGLLEDESLQERLGGNARELAVEKYAYDRIGAELAERFESLLLGQ